MASVVWCGEDGGGQGRGTQEGGGADQVLAAVHTRLPTPYNHILLAKLGLDLLSNKKNKYYPKRVSSIWTKVR